MRQPPFAILCLRRLFARRRRGCAGVTKQAIDRDGGAGTGTGGNGRGRRGCRARSTMDRSSRRSAATASLDTGEQCDDGNKTPRRRLHRHLPDPRRLELHGLAQRCTTAASAATASSADEQCDDGNTTAGDGCSATAKVDTGYECRVPGRKCIPTCGDGMINGGEKCDDGNTDERRRLLQHLPGRAGRDVPARGGKCTRRRLRQRCEGVSEGCDCGTDAAKLPSGCPGPNGLFFGDGTGCSKTCTKEPKCRDARQDAGLRHHLRQRQQGDGRGLRRRQPATKGDGCYATARSRGASPARRRCRTTPRTARGAREVPEAAGHLPRLQERERSGGHPDFFYLGATITGGPTVDRRQAGAITYNKRYCVSNSGGPAKKNDSVARCWDLARRTWTRRGNRSSTPPAAAEQRLFATASSPTGATTATAATSRHATPTMSPT